MSDRPARLRGSGAARLAAIFVMVALGLQTGPAIAQYGKKAETSLDVALGAAKWLDASAIRTPYGLAWPADPADPKSVNPTLYAGTPGVVLFYLEATASALALGRRDQAAAFRDKARAGADELLSAVASVKSAGLYEGLAGIGFVLEETHKATGDMRYRQGFMRCLQKIRTLGRVVGRGVEWGPVTDIIGGTAGTGLFLLYAHERLQEKPLLDLAIAAGERLMQLGKPKSGGLDWAMDPSYERLMPNFAHGTAGVAFFLARLHARTQRKEFLAGALAGGRYLLSIAAKENGACLIYHHEPDGKDLYYLGWCHGPVGTANLFFELHKVTGDPVWLDWVHREARGLMDSGIPERETPGFWNNAGICCGLAGVADFFLNLSRATGQERYLAFGRRVLARLAAKATVERGGRRWIQAEHRTKPDFVVAQTGLMQGAAGIGLVFLRWDAFDRGLSPAIRMPDTAFP